MVNHKTKEKKWWDEFTTQTNARQMNTLSANPWASFSSRKVASLQSTAALSPRRVLTPCEEYQPPSFGTDPPSCRQARP